MTNEDMQRLLHLIEQAEELDEVDFKKALATAALAGTLATAPMDAKADGPSADNQVNQPVATQVAPDVKGELLVGKYHAGMSIEQIVELSGGKIKKNGVGGAFTDIAINGGSGLIEPKDIKVVAKEGKITKYFEFDNNNKLKSVHTLMAVSKDVKKGQGFFGFKRAEMGKVFNRAWKVFGGSLGQPQGKAKSSDGGSFGLGVGGVTSSGKGVGLGLDKVGSGVAWIETTEGAFTMSYSTQKGMVNTFRPMGVIVSHVSSTVEKPEIEFE